jgi:hypothetical protein
MLLAFLVLTGACSSSSSQSSSAVHAPPTTSTTAVPATVPLNEFGATDQVWNSRHKPAPNQKADTAYDPDPALPPVNGQVAPRYQFVLHDKGRIVQLVRELPSGTAIDAARGFAMEELPSDATVLWFAVKDTCAQLEVQSASLATALSPNGDTGGLALVEFTTIQPNGAANYNPNNIGGLRITATAAYTPSDVPTC